MLRVMTKLGVFEGCDGVGVEGWGGKRDPQGWADVTLRGFALWLGGLGKAA